MSYLQHESAVRLGLGFDKTSRLWQRQVCGFESASLAAQAHSETKPSGAHHSANHYSHIDERPLAGGAWREVLGRGGVDVLPYPGPLLLMPCTHTAPGFCSASWKVHAETDCPGCCHQQQSPPPLPAPLPHTQLPGISGSAAVGAIDAVPPWVALAEATLAHAAAVALIETELQRRQGAG